MLPVLLQIGNFKLYTFGVFLVLAFFWGSFMVWKLTRISSYKEEDVFDGIFTCLFGGLIISRIIYIIFNWGQFGFNLLKFILVNGYPGFSFIGFLLGFFITLFLYSSSKKISFKMLADYITPGFLLAVAIGKLGSFFSGVESGTKTTFLLSVKYAGFDGVRHLTPLYESILFFLFFAVSYRFLFEMRKDKYPVGWNISFLSWSVGFIYAITDMIKPMKLVVGGISFNFVAAIILLLTFSFYFVYYFRILIKNKFVSIIQLFTKNAKKNQKVIHRPAKKGNS